VNVLCYLAALRGSRTITDMAQASGVARPYLSQIEAGRRLPRDDEVEGIARAYGAPLREWYPAEVLLVVRYPEGERCHFRLRGAAPDPVVVLRPSRRMGLAAKMG
jgi:transcriptional regulator with XRE-family HTH domain